MSNRKKYLCPEEKGITTPTTFFLVSFKQQKTPHHGNTKKRMLAANFTCVLEAFQPRVYPRTNSLLSITWRKLLYVPVFQKMSRICLNTACPRITTELCIFFHMFGWDVGAAEGQFVLWHIFTNQLVIDDKTWLNKACFWNITIQNVLLLNHHMAAM